MAPFKLKFRMGSSRSTSQEHDPDPQVNEALLNHHNSTAIGASSSTIDSADCTSLGSLGTSERKSLLPIHKSNTLRLGYLNPNVAQNSTTSGSAPGTSIAAVPQTPPPSYEHVLEENTRLTNTIGEFSTPRSTRTTGATIDDNRQNSGVTSISRNNEFGSDNHLSTLDGFSPCTDPDCIENFANEHHQFAKVSAASAQRRILVGNSNVENNNASSNNNNTIYNITNNNEQLKHHHLQQKDEFEIDQNTRDNQIRENNSIVNTDVDDAFDGTKIVVICKESNDSTELLLPTNMATTTTTPSSQENLLYNCGAECQERNQCCGCDEGCSHNDGAEGCEGNHCNDTNTSCGTSNEAFCDPLINHGGYHSNEHSRSVTLRYTERHSDSDSEDADGGGSDGGAGGGGTVGDGGSGWHDRSQMSSGYQQMQRRYNQYEQQQQQQCHYQQVQHPQQQHQQQQQQQECYYTQQDQRSQTPEIISNKSSKEIYKDLAKQWGITCKMSDGCRCMECQSHYFDCEYDDNEHQKSDGGLGAGTPMFISEVMHGTACTIL